jgi:CO/xanthine dehydrogenase Mo-binding subunit
MSRSDGWAKAAGDARYVADLALPGMLHVALTRSAVPHGRIAGIDTTGARAVEGVTGVFTAADVTSASYGRSVRDVPILARDKVRFTGERVAAVVATSRRAAEEAAALVDVEYEELPAVLSADEALAPSAPAVHDQPWAYPGAAAQPDGPRNVQSVAAHGSRTAAEEALGRAEYIVDRTYSTVSGHQGYLEPQACVASVDRGQIRVWTTNKSPYRLRSQLAECLGLDPASIVVEPVPLGGDFGGKGSPMDVPLCAELARLTGHPVKLVLRYAEDLTATNPRHPARIRVRAGCDRHGKLLGIAVRAVLNGGAYAGFKPLPNVNLHGVLDCLTAYHVPAAFTESVIAYTNTVPRGHMRSPGAPQAAFAVESALDELAQASGLDPAGLRRRNLAGSTGGGSHGTGPGSDGSGPGSDGTGPGSDGSGPDGTGQDGTGQAGDRGEQTLEAALREAAASRPAVPRGWLHGSGIAVYARAAPALPVTSVRLAPAADGRIRAEVPIPETGTGSHTVVANRLAAELGISADRVEVAQVSTAGLPFDPGVGASRVTLGMSEAISRAARAWRSRAGDEPVVAEGGADGPGEADGPVISYCAQVAQVAVDPGTGQVRVLEILSAVDVGQVVNPLAHQMQIDGGAVMGYGFGCLEDLAEDGGQVWAASMSEFKIPSMKDVPALRTVLVTGGRGLTEANVKPVGELSNVPAAAAIANAVAAATGCRIRDLPVTAEKVYWSLPGPGGLEASGQEQHR